MENIYYCKKCNEIYSYEDNGVYLCEKCKSVLLNCNITEEEYFARLTSDYGFKKGEHNTDYKIVNDGEDSLWNDLLSLTDNPKVLEMLKSRIVLFFSNNPTAKIALVTGLITVVVFLTQFVVLMFHSAYLNHFNISIHSIDYSFVQCVNSFPVMITVFICFAINVMLCYVLLDFFNRRKACGGIIYDCLKLTKIERLQCLFKDIIKYLPICLIIIFLQQFLNVLIYNLFLKGDLKVTIVHNVTICLFFSMLQYYMVGELYPKYKKRKNVEGTNIPITINRKLNIYCSYAMVNRPILIDLLRNKAIIAMLIVSLLSYIYGGMYAENIKTFYIVDNQYAIVYQTENYYWMVKIEEIGETIVLDTSVQKSIPIANAEKIKYGVNNVTIK